MEKKELLKILEEKEKKVSYKYNNIRYEHQDFDYYEGRLSMIQNIIGIIKDLD